MEKIKQLFIVSVISLVGVGAEAQLGGSAPATPAWEKNSDASGDMERNEDWKNALEKKSADQRASSGFVSRFKLAQTALEKGNIKNADEQIQKLHAMSNLNLYETARLYLMDYWYAGKTGDKVKETEALEALMPIAYGKIDSPAFVEAGVRLLKRQYNAKDYGGAVETLTLLKQDPASMAELNSIASAVSVLEKMKQADQNISHSISTDASGVWKGQLIHRYFYLNKIEGLVKTVDFNCENKKATINYQSDSVMATQEAWGKCGVKIQADPNTKYDLTELVNKPN